MRDLHLPGRSPVYAPNAAIATSHPLATQAGLAVLKSRGNAADAAVAACAVQCVVEPHMTGIGGDCFALVSPKGDTGIHALNGSGAAPAKAELGWFLDQGKTEFGLSGDPHSITVPGAIGAWAALLEKFGSRSLGELLQPAIAYARDGFAVTPRVGSDWADAAHKLKENPAAAAALLKGGEAPAIGARMSQPALAKTLQIIADQGRDGFYTGAVAEDIVASLNKLGGLHSLDDFANAAPEWVEPIKGGFASHDVYECPPNGQGLCALMIMGILDRHDLTSLSQADRVHLIAEATKLGYAERDRYIGDPRQVRVPVDAMLSASHLDALNAMIDMDKAGSFAESDFPTHKDTIYLACVDENGMAVSFINSLFSDFGSCIMSENTGVLLHNRGRQFQLKEGHANAIAPNKRPMHTIIPAMLVKDGQVVAPFGVMGGQFQSTGQSIFLSNLLVRGMDVQEALDDSRSFATEGTLQVESTFEPATYAALEAKGHELTRMPKPIGGGQAVMIDRANGVLIAGSDPRKDGMAAGY